MRIMYSDLVVADVTYPNPNVLYELGLRHACRVGTVIIRDRNGPRAPFDIAYLRHIEYENTATGLKKLADGLRTYFNSFLRYPDRPDNQLLELAKLTNYDFPTYGKVQKQQAAQIAFMSAILESPELIKITLRQMKGENIDSSEMSAALLASKPEVVLKLMTAINDVNSLSK